MVIVGPPNPEKERPPQPRKPEVKLTFLESLPNWRLFSRFGELPKGQLRQAAIFYWLLVTGVLGLLIHAFSISDKPNNVEWVVNVLIATIVIVTLVYWGIARVALWVSDLMPKKKTQKKSNRFGQMHKGIRRILYCLNFIIAVAAWIFFMNNLCGSNPKDVGMDLLGSAVFLVFVTAVFWWLVRICLWIFDGFKEEKEKELKSGNTKQ